MKVPKDYLEALKIIKKQKWYMFGCFFLGVLTSIVALAFLLEYFTYVG